MTVRYAYDGANAIVEYEYDSTSLTGTRSYVHGTEYIDERAVMRDHAQDPVAADDQNGQDHYYLLKDLYTVAGLAACNGGPEEYYEYDTYGQVTMYEWPVGTSATWESSSDLDRSGQVTVTDQSAILNARQGSDTNPFWDVDFSGDLTTADDDVVDAAASQSLEAIVVSYSSVDNPYFFTGRITDTLHADDLVADNDPDGVHRIQDNRNRMYDTKHGRWLQRDPIGYVDGMNLYEYVRSSPLTFSDPFGTLKASIELRHESRRRREVNVIRKRQGATEYYEHLWTEYDIASTAQYGGRLTFDARLIDNQRGLTYFVSNPTPFPEVLNTNLTSATYRVRWMARGTELPDAIANPKLYTTRLPGGRVAGGKACVEVHGFMQGFEIDEQAYKGGFFAGVGVAGISISTAGYVTFAVSVGPFTVFAGTSLTPTNTTWEVPQSHFALAAWIAADGQRAVAAGPIESEGVWDVRIRKEIRDENTYYQWVTTVKEITHISADPGGGMNNFQDTWGGRTAFEAWSGEVP